MNPLVLGGLAAVALMFLMGGAKKEKKAQPIPAPPPVPVPKPTPQPVPAPPIVVDPDEGEPEWILPTVKPDLIPGPLFDEPVNPPKAPARPMTASERKVADAIGILHAMAEPLYNGTTNVQTVGKSLEAIGWSRASNDSANVEVSRVFDAVVGDATRDRSIVDSYRATKDPSNFRYMITSPGGIPGTSERRRDEALA
jgi:hypothetical protein